MKTHRNSTLLFALGGLLLCALAPYTFAAAETAAAQTEKPAWLEPFSFGGDFRLRQEAMDNVPIRTGGYTRSPNDYFRFRTRLWLTFKPVDAISFNTRMVHEIFQFVKPSNSKTFRWPDELIFDRLNIALKLLDDSTEVVIGRQDIQFPGYHRILSEGTAKDGSRSFYMDGASARIRMNENKTRLSLFGAYTRYEDPLAIGSVNRDLTGYEFARNRMDEAGAGVFLDQQLCSNLAAGVYYVWKHDTAWQNAAGERQPNEDIHTVGAQLTAKPIPGMTAEIEAAGQWSPTSDSDRRAMMAAAMLSRHFAPDSQWNPYLSLHSIYFSGDDPDTRRREDWNPLWARSAWLTDMLLYTYDGDGAYLMQNLVYTYLEGGFHFRPKHRLSASLGQLYAPEANGTGGGHNRGYLGTAKYDFPLWSSTRTGGPRLFGFIAAQALQPDNYYENDDRLAYFIRWQLDFVF